MPPYGKTLMTTTTIPFIKPLTVWERYNKQDNGQYKWEHNHIEFGHCPNEVPTPLCEAHKKIWSGGQWRKSLRYLDENNVVI